MPAPFNRCVRNGGKVRTKSLPNNKYMHICYKDGNSFGGEVKTKKSSNTRKRRKKK